jgi:ribosomal protein S18 acetylase RimI-like enzyme
MTPRFRLEQLGRIHKRGDFSCGEPELDRYFKTQVRQDIDRRVTKCTVAIEVSSERVAAFYTLATASVPLSDFPPEITKKLPFYPAVPAAKIGRLAVDEGFQGQGLGRAMLADATARIVEAPMAVFTLLVDAKSEKAIEFYQRYNFELFVNQRKTLFLPMATAIKFLVH